MMKKALYSVGVCGEELSEDVGLVDDVEYFANSGMRFRNETSLMNLNDDEKERMKRILDVLGEVVDDTDKLDKFYVSFKTINYVSSYDQFVRYFVYVK